MIEFASIAESLIINFGYMGVFLVSFIGSATVILPLPAFTVIFIAGALLDPWFVAFLSALGSAFGELVAYGVGHFGRKLSSRIAQKRKKEQGFSEKLEKGKAWLHNKPGFLLIVLFAATPLPDDIMGIACGVLHYDWKKFLLATFLGKFMLSLMLAFTGEMTLGWLFV